MPVYDDTLTLREARQRYFETNGFGDDGGYGAKWVKLNAYGVPLVFPNTSARVRAVRIHDLHHVVTGYDTDFPGEAEISAFEVASSCRDYVAAWMLDLWCMAIGTLGNARRVFHAFVRGRHASNLYDLEFGDPLLERHVGDVRGELELAGAAPEATRADRVAYAGWLATAFVFTVFSFALLLAPVGWVGWLAFRALTAGS